MAKRTLVGLALLGVIGGARAWAVDDTCNGLLDLTYPAAPAVSQVGDVIAVQVRLGTGPIQGGSELQLDGRVVDTPQDTEYARVYAHFAELVRERRSDVDLAPFRLVADAFLCGRRVEVAPFNE